MHEVALAQSLIELIESQLRQHGASRVRRVHLAIGTLSHVDARALRLAFEVARSGGPAASAELEISEPPGRAWCFDCAESVLIAQRGEPCPRCGGARLIVDGGEEMKLIALEVDSLA